MRRPIMSIEGESSNKGGGETAGTMRGSKAPPGSTVEGPWAAAIGAPEQTVTELIAEARQILSEERAAVAVLLRSRDEMAVLTIDPLGVITAVNQHSSKLLGKSPAEIVGKTIDSVLGSGIEGIDESADEMKRADRGEIVESVRTHRRLDGTTFEGDHVVIAIVGLHGEQAGFIREVRDRAALRAHEVRIEELVMQIAVLQKTAC